MSRQVHLRTPLLFNGISQQPPQLRFPSQVEDATNTIFSVVRGASKRPGTIFVTDVANLNANQGYRVHAIERDDEEKYLAILGEGVLRVFESNGREANVTVSQDAQDYIERNNPRPSQLRIISIRDFSFIVNTTVPVKSKDDDPNDSETTDALDETTMPIQMVRTAVATSGTPAQFDVSLVTWKKRQNGDDTTNPPPSLWEEQVPISDIAFHRNRLVLAGREFVVFSQAGDLFNFYTQDPTNVVDSDPIDVSVSAPEVTIVDYITPFRKSLVIFTKASRQFELNAPESLTPDTAAITASTSYRTLSVEPKVLGPVLYFIGSKRGSAALYEYFFDDTRVSNTAAEVSSHVPNFLSGKVRSLALSPNDQMVFILPQRGSGGTIGEVTEGLAQDQTLATESGDTLITEGSDEIVTNAIETGSNILGVYRARWNGNEKQQSAWSKYEFPYKYRVSDMAMIQNQLYMLIEDAEEGHFTIEAMSVEEEIDPRNPGSNQFLLPTGDEGGFG